MFKSLFGVTLLVALVMAWLPVDLTVGRFVYDDMFYYLRVAEHVVAGHGLTFDGVGPTNGFHPLWMLLCTGFATFASGDLLVHCVLTVAAVLHVVQGVLLLRLMRRLSVRNGVAFAVLAIYLLNWRTLAVNLCGLETPLAIVALLFVFDRLLAAPIRPAVGGALRFGALLGAAVLCRFDLLLLCGFAGVWLLLERRHAEPLPAPRRLQLGGLAAAGALLSLLPWFVISFFTSHALLPNSRIAVHLLAGPSYDWGDLGAVLAQLKAQFWECLWWSTDTTNLMGLYPLVASRGRGMQVSGALVFLLVAFVGYSLLRSRQKAAAKLALLPLLYCAMHVGYYTVFHRIEVRYILPAIALFQLPLAVAFEQLLQRRPGIGARRVLVGLGSAGFVVATVAGVTAMRLGHGSVRAHKHHYVAQEMARWLRAERPDAVVGAWNAGVLSYWSRTELVNLDGVINDPVLPSVADRTLGEYVRRRGIELIVDEPGQIEHNLSRFDATHTTHPLLGRVVHACEDDEGRRIVAYEVRRD